MSADQSVPPPHPMYATELGQRSNSKGQYFKRVIVCCDGTWDDGLIVTERWKYTNVLKLARTIKHTDDRYDPPVPQIVFYQSGVGTDDTSLLSKIEGAVGAHLASKVQEAYSFIAHNYRPGDEIFLFGFSRGAYTARMVAAMIGEIGVLDRTDMDHFASVFMAFQKRGKEKDPEGNIAEIAKLDKELHPWVQHNSPGKLRADSDEHSFSIKCVGVFDTVGSVGLPEELTHSQTVKTLFGFSDRTLGEHIQRAYHAMALNETREDFNVCKFEQTPGGHSKGQKLDQVWFSGSHSDIGGGWQEHDLSDLTLWWMVSKIQDIIAVDARYLTSLVDPVAPWGQLPPHDPRTGIMKLTDTVTRTLPTSTNDVTHEKIHLSVLHQSHLMPALKQNIDANPALVAELTQLEAELKHYWPFVPGTHLPYMPQGVKKHGDDRVEMALASVFEKGVSIGKDVFSKLHKHEAMQNESGEPVLEESRVTRLVEESSVGVFVKELKNGKYN